MNFLIYHNEHFLEHSYTMLPGERSPRYKLNLVAKVDAINLDDAYRATNHIRESWWRNPEMIWWRPSRSTSVGDVIYNMYTESYHKVDSFGFKRLEPWHELTTYFLEKDLPDAPQIFVNIFTIDRSPTARLRRLVLRQLYWIRTHLELPFLRE